MSDRANREPNIIKIPGPDHPITIERNAHRIVVVAAGRVVADTRAALTLREASYPPVQYIPLKDVDTTLLERTDHATYCPYKGDCAYYSIPLGGERSVNAVWTYEAPYAAVAAIENHLAFYPDRVDAIEEPGLNALALEPGGRPSHDGSNLCAEARAAQSVRIPTSRDMTNQIATQAAG